MYIEREKNFRFKDLISGNRHYIIMQSVGDSFGGDVVSDSFIKTFRDEDNNLDQINRSKYVRIISVMIVILYNNIRKCILTVQ